MNKIVKDIFTENDGVSYCPLRVIGGLLVIPSICIVLASGVVHLHDGTMKLIDFVQAVGAMAGVVSVVFGAAVAIKAMTDKPAGGGAQ